MKGHTDSVWGLASIGPSQSDEVVASCSADGTCRLWKPAESAQPLATIVATEGRGDIGYARSVEVIGFFFQVNPRQLMPYQPSRITAFWVIAPVARLSSTLNVSNRLLRATGQVVWREKRNRGRVRRAI